MLENVEHITKITMHPTAITLCDIGNDWYKNNLEIEFIPSRFYPDYMQVEKWIMSEIDGKRLNIEQVVAKIYEYLLSVYAPAKLRVVDRVTGNKVHFDVVVEKE